MTAEVELASVWNMDQGRQLCCDKSGYLEID